MSYKTYLENRTPYVARILELPDLEGQLCSLIVVKQSFVDDGAGTMVVASEQSPVALADVHFGDPSSTSLRAEAEVALHKPRVDVIVFGRAYAPAGRAVEKCEVELAIGALRKRLAVFGDRRWSRFKLGLRPSRPEPFLSMPIVYERAFGGVVRSEPAGPVQAADARNLSGVGYRGARSADPQVETELPNIEYVDDGVGLPSDRPRPAGLGIVSRGWSPRLERAGTFDDAWREQRWPFLPSDFDPRHNQIAPDDQQLPQWLGTEHARLVNLTPEGDWRFQLPSPDVPCLLLFGDRSKRVALRADTIMIEPDVKRVTVTRRYVCASGRGRQELREVVLGPPTPARLLALRTGKHHIDWGQRRMPSDSPTGAEGGS